MLVNNLLKVATYSGIVARPGDRTGVPEFEFQVR